MMSNSPQKKPIQLVFIRHGESEWNASKRFSGWVDIDLTEKGRQQAVRAGKLLRLNNIEFDEAHTSVLKRAVRTLWTALHSSNQHWTPVKHTWRLNERHYGALTGLSKQDAKEQLGAEMLLKYRRGYNVAPMPMTENHPCWTGGDRRYRDLGPLLPRGESLKMCLDRILPYWYESVVPSIRSGRTVLIAAHNNVIRCLCKHLDQIADDDLIKLEVPTGAPIVYTLDPLTLEPMGAADEIGFTGEFITEETTAAKHRHMAARIEGAPSLLSDPTAEKERATMEAATEDKAKLQQPHAALDAALKRVAGKEYDLESVVMGMKIHELFTAEELRREANRLGLGSPLPTLLRTEARSVSAPSHMMTSSETKVQEPLGAKCTH